MKYSNLAGLLALGLLPLAGRAQAPTLVSRTPARNATAAARASNVVLTFSKPLSSSTAGQVRMFSRQRGGQLVRANNVTVTGSSLTIDPANDLRAGETVLVTLPGTVLATDGSAVAKQVYQFTAATTGGSGIFANSPDVTLGNSSRRILLADVDGDGDVDLLAGDYYAGLVNVQFNNGQGMFSGGSSLAVGSYPNIAVADIDGDGDIDLLACNDNPFGAGTVSVRLNDGNGSFRGSTSLVVGGGPRSITATDVDGDGDLDLLTANSNTSTVSVRLNDGSGNFSTTPDVPVGPYPYQCEAADLDNDGDVDLLTFSSGGAAVSLNDGNGNFSGPSSVPLGTGAGSLVAADIDRDGDLDLLATSNSTQPSIVSVSLNNGSGGFSSAPAVAVGSNPIGLAVVDVDSDGDLDLLTADNGSTTVSVRLNDGNGSFSTAPDVPVSLYPQSLAAADVDGDGDLDFLTGAGSIVSVRLNQNALLASHLPASG